MKHLFLLFVFCVSFCAQAQLAIIQDSDGYVNMRSEPSNSGKIIRKLIASDMFFCLKPDGDWYAIAVYVKDSLQYSSGYIHKSRVKFIHEYDSVYLSQASKDKLIFKNKTVQVDIKTKPFDRKANSIEYAVDDVNHRYVKTINHKSVWGTDGGLPDLAYEYIRVTIAGNNIALPAKAYDNLYQSDFRHMKVYQDVQNDIIYIEGLNGDGAGAYIFAIVIKNKQFEKTVAMIPF